MADTPPQGKPRFLHRQYLLDEASQLPLAGWVLCILGGIGLLYACALFYLLGTELVLGKTVAEMRLVLLIVHGVYFLLAAGILYVAVLLLTHRYAGPALVMRRALVALRHGDFTPRLSLRRRDFHKDLAEEVRLLRDELAERDATRVDVYDRLDAALESGDVPNARALLAELRAGTAAERAKRAQAEQAAA